MSKRFKKVLAIISLVFMALFAVTLSLTCFDPTMLNGSIGFAAMFTGFIGISVFLVIKLSSHGDGSTSVSDTDGQGGDSTEQESDEQAEHEAEQEEVAAEEEKDENAQTDEE